MISCTCEEECSFTFVCFPKGATYTVKSRSKEEDKKGISVAKNENPKVKQ